MRPAGQTCLSGGAAFRRHRAHRLGAVMAMRGRWLWALAAAGLAIVGVPGAPLLGVKGAVVKAHGSSNEVAFCNASRQAAEVAQSGIIADIEANIDKMRISRED